MNTENEKRLDDLFKKKLEDPVDEIRYEEGDWDALEGMLDKSRKRKAVVYLWPILSGVAALLLIFLGWWMFSTKNGNQAGDTFASSRTKDTITGNNKIASVHDTILDKTKVTASVKDTILDKTVSIATTKKDTILDKTQAIAHTVAVHKNIPVLKKNAIPQQVSPLKKDNQAIFAQQVAVPKKDTILDKSLKQNKVNNDAYAANQQPTVTPAQRPVQQSVTPPAVSNDAGLAANTPAKPKIKPQMAYRPQYTLSVVAAPDLNGVNSFAQSKVGTNIGLTFAAGLSRKLTVSTGALYSVKPYLTSFSNYKTGSAYQWPVDPQSVTADCRMLDIPLNVAYQVYHKQQNKISIGTGLSSYIMLHESYKFTYNNNYQYGGASGPANYTVPNPGRYFFGVMNLNATYERQLNSKVGISIQPYLKVPLSNVGYSQVKLQTTGIAVGLSWNLNSLTKP